MLKIFSKIFKKPKHKSMQLKDQECFKEQLPGFKAPGYTASSLKQRGFPTWAVKSAGYSLDEMKDAGFSARQLKMAGFSKDEVDAKFKK